MTQNAPTLILLHGFAGSQHTWDVVRGPLSRHFRLLAVDLPGHGQTPVPEQRITFAVLADVLANVAREASSGQRYWCGYSMGGRIALHVALYHPEVVDKLALIGAAPGIEDSNEQAQRRAADRDVAAKIRRNGIAWFEDYWSKLPNFASQNALSPELQEKLKQERLANDPGGLALALENWGTGEQEWLLPRLAELRCPVLLMAGEHDPKFRALSERMAEIIPHSEFVVIPNAGHAAHIENPQAVEQALVSFFQ